jgi:hypothetical protein
MRCPRMACQASLGKGDGIIAETRKLGAKLVCPNGCPPGTELRVQRTNTPQTENEWPKRFAGVNGIMRRRICQNCKDRIVTLEITERDLERMIQRGTIAIANT